jgi:hypothetical protein
MSSTCTRTSRRTLNPLVAAALLAGALLIGTGVADGSGHGGSHARAAAGNGFDWNSGISGHAVPGQGILVPGVHG